MFRFRVSGLATKCCLGLRAWGSGVSCWGCGFRAPETNLVQVSGIGVEGFSGLGYACFMLTYFMFSHLRLSGLGTESYSDLGAWVTGLEFRDLC